MRSKFLQILTAIFLSCTLCLSSIAVPPANADELPLSLWRDGETKAAIIDFVRDVTNPKSPNFVEVGDRIAVFDNDGTLWSEKPCYFQESFIVSRLEGSDGATCFPDTQGSPAPELGELMLVDLQFTGITSDAYKDLAREFLGTNHPTEPSRPQFERPYLDFTYQPAIELLDYLRGHGFQIYICSGGGIDFIRSFAEEAYGIPPEHIIGSAIQSKFEIQDGKPVTVRRPIPVLPVNDGPGKPVGLERYLGKRPILAMGNSDGDLEMLQYTDDNQGRELMLLLHHDDGDREFAYETADEALAEAAKYDDWHVISMKDDFLQVFSWE